MPLTIIDAPAGYGKTTILLQLLGQLESAGSKVAWLSLDEEDRSPEQFIAYVVFSLKNAGVILPQLEEAAATRLLDIEYRKAINPLLAGIENCPDGIVMMLDDYHHVTGSAVDEVMNLILARLPANLKMIVAGRGRPGFRFEQQRASDQAVVISKDELAFSEQELRDYFAGRLSAVEAQMLYARTQGWPAVLQLVTLWLDRNRGSVMSLDRFTGRSRDLATYLAEQIILTLPDDIKDFLHRIAILDTIEGPAAIALTGRQDALLVIEDLEARGLPILSLNEERSAFRYHQLFSEFLRDRLQRANPDLAKELHTKASVWFMEAGNDIQAARHATAAGDVLRAAACLERSGGWHHVLRGRLWNLLEFKNLPPSAFRAHPQLRLGQIYLMGREGMVKEARAAYDDLQRITDNFRQLQGRDWNVDVEIGRLVVDLALRMYEGKPIHLEDVERIQRMIGSLKTSDKILPIVSRHLMAIYYYDCGDLEKCHQMAAPLVQEWRSAQTLSMANYMASYSARALFGLGHAREAEEVLVDILAEMNEFFAEASRSGAVAPLFLAEIKYEQGDMDSARRLLGDTFSRMVDVEVWFDLEVSGYRTATLLAFQDQGVSAALEILDRGAAAALSRGVERVAQYLTVLRHYVLVLSGDLSAALKVGPSPFAALLDVDPAQDPYAWQLSHTAKISYARQRLYEDKAEEALTILQPVLHFARKAAHKRYLLEALIVAAAAASKSSPSQALTYLQEAVDIASPQGFVRPFLDEGVRFQELAAWAVTQADSGLTDVQQSFLASLQVHGRTPAAVAARTDGAPSLSDREREVWEMIGAGLSGKEIAARLGIAESTVKTHRKSLYRKLGVHRRSSAVAKLVG